MSSTGNGSGRHGDSEVKTDIITLTRFLTEEQHRLGPHATGDFTFVALVSSTDGLWLIIVEIDCCVMLSSSHLRVLRTALPRISADHELTLLSLFYSYYIRRATLINVRPSISSLTEFTNSHA